VRSGGSDLEMMDVPAKGSQVTNPAALEILRVENLRKSHIRNNGKGREELGVLDDISFHVDEGEFVTIIGPSGCGKTTLLSIVAGMDTYDSGKVMVMGRNATPRGGSAVIIFQEDALFPWLTVTENVAFGLRSKGLTKAERTRIAGEFVDMVQLSQFANSYMHELSGGMKQRVAIARGLAMDPRVLLMDEPFGALDYRTREILQQQIQQIHEKTRKTIIFVTHDVREAVSLGDRVLLLSKRPARVKREYTVDLPRPRSSEDPALHGMVKDIVGELKKEVAYSETPGEINDGPS
jgi:NitT/TauT family transport system ATP-binding protein